MIIIYFIFYDFPFEFYECADQLQFRFSVVSSSIQPMQQKLYALCPCLSTSVQIL